MLKNSNYGELVVSLAEMLTQEFGDKLAVYDFDGEPGAHRISYSIIEIMESSEKLISIVNNFLSSKDSIEDLHGDFIADFKDELEHIVYHVNDSGVFTSLMNDDS